MKRVGLVFTLLNLVLSASHHKSYHIEIVELADGIAQTADPFVATVDADDTSYTDSTIQSLMSNDLNGDATDSDE
jgi:hypothetical protein